MLGFQAEGAAPIVKGHVIENPETIATAIRIGNPARWKEAQSAARESGGSIEAVTDDQIIEAYKLVASTEGIFVEAASAASIAGLFKMVSEGRIEKGSTCVAVLTGHGLKDPDTAIKTADEIRTVPADIDEVKKIVLG
jgi:threonine synthase